MRVPDGGGSTCHGQIQRGGARESGGERGDPICAARGPRNQPSVSPVMDGWEPRGADVREPE